jgi:hypothetical protein
MDDETTTTTFVDEMEATLVAYLPRMEHGDLSREIAEALLRPDGLIWPLLVATGRGGCCEPCLTAVLQDRGFGFSLGLIAACIAAGKATP